MGIITKMLKQTGVYWALGSTLTEYGKPTYDSPVEISVRWEDVVEEFMDAEGSVQKSRSLVYVDRDVAVGSVLMLGSLTTGVDTTNPKNNDGAWEVRHFEKLPNFKATEFLRTAYL
jgi:hypothetical protein